MVNVRTLKLLSLSFCCCSILLLSGCSKRERSSATSETKPPEGAAPSADQPIVDACTLLTSEEIAAVQGEAVKETKQHRETSGGLAISQCHFALPTSVNFVNLRVVQKAAGPKGRDPSEVWRETFAPEKLQGLKRAPEPVRGVGDAAFWMGHQKPAGLYVLERNVYVLVYVGGADDKDTKVKKCSELARKALSRL
jgi:hypothetical protein